MWANEGVQEHASQHLLLVQRIQNTGDCAGDNSAFILPCSPDHSERFSSACLPV
jgi:hypothetical protein